MGIFDKVKKEYKRTEKRVKKEVDRIVDDVKDTVDKVEDKVEKEVDRFEAKYSPKVAIEELSKLNTDDLAKRLKEHAIISAKLGILITLDWLEFELKASTNKLDDIFLPLISPLKDMVRDVADKVK